MDSARFIVNADEAVQIVDPDEEFLVSLDRLTTHYPPVHTCSTGWKFEGFYNGPTSIAYLFYRLSQMFPEMEFKQQSLLDWAEAYLALGARRTKKEPNSSNCGITNETLAHLSLTAVMERNTNPVRQICSFDESVNDKQHPGSDEWMYGRAGYLYFLRLCSTLIKETEAPESGTAILLEKTIQNTVVRILATPPPHLWHGKEYFGAAHGTIGIIAQLVLTRPSAAPALHATLEQLLDRQLTSGNFPSSASSQSDRLVQFCHGAPGFVIALRPLLPHFPPQIRRRVEDAMRRTDADIWKRGLLAKTPCLCHGIPSNALALTEGGRDRFMRFLSWMGAEEMQRRGWSAESGSDGNAAGLYTGEAGRAWAWGIAMSKGPGVLVGFNDL